MTVVIQPLTPAEVDRYLDRGGEQLRNIRLLVERDPQLYELFNVPLMISIASVAYQGASGAEILAQEPIRSREQLFARYVTAMLHERRAKPRYGEQQTVRWLAWLASLMQRRDRTDFRLEELNGEWLPKTLAPRVESMVRWVTVVASGAVFGLGFGIAVGLNYDLKSGLGYGLAGMIAYIVLSGRDRGSGGTPVDSLTWSWSASKSTFGLRSKLRRVFLAKSASGFIVRIAVVLAIGLIGGPLALLSMAVALIVVGVAFGLAISGFVPAARDKRSTPNEGTWKSRRNATAGALVVLLAGVVVGYLGPVLGTLRVEWLRGGLMGVPSNSLAGVLIGGLFAARITGMFKQETGGVFVVRHYAARLCLRWLNYMPLNCIPFFNHAADRIFMFRVGGAYFFFHAMVRDYFASLAKAEPPGI